VPGTRQRADHHKRNSCSPDDLLTRDQAAPPEKSDERKASYEGQWLGELETTKGGPCPFIHLQGRETRIVLSVPK